MFWAFFYYSRVSLKSKIMSMGSKIGSMESKDRQTEKKLGTTLWLLSKVEVK